MVNRAEAMFPVVVRSEFDDVFLIVHVLSDFEKSIQFDVENFVIISK